MRKAMKKILPVLSVMLVFALAGCGSKSNDNASLIDKNTIYSEEELPIGFSDNSYVQATAMGTDRIYIAAYSYDPNDYSQTNYLYSVKADGSDIKNVTLLDGVDGWLDGVYADKDDNAYAVYSTYYEDDSDPDNYIWENIYYVSKYDSDLNLVNTWNLSDMDISYIGSLLLLDDGRFLMYADKLYLTDENFNIVKTRDYSENGDYFYINQIFRLSDGTPCVYYWDDNGEGLAKVNLDTLEIDEKLDLPFEFYNYSYYGGNGDYDILLMSNSGISGYKLGTEAPVEIFNFVNSDIETSYFDSFSIAGDGSFIGTYSEWTNDGSTSHICRYVKADPDTIKDKTILTLGCTYIDTGLRSQVIKFNKSNDEYRIVIKDYSTYQTEDDYEAGTNQLNSDIAAGQSPDIIFADSPGTVINYQEKGLFADLNKYLDKDEDVNKDDIWPNLIAACESNGKLYQIVPRFYVETLVGKKSLLGDRSSWTLAEMEEFENSLPESSSLFGAGISRETMLNRLIAVNGTGYLDTANATCNFDSDGFKSILNYVKNYPSSDDIEIPEDYYSDYDSMYRSEKVVLYDWYMSGFSDYQYVVEGLFGEDVAYVGYPTDSGCGSAIYFYGSVAISAKSKNQDGAWEFVKTFWTDEYQDTIEYGIPASMSKFDELAAEAMKRPSYESDGETYYYDNTYYIGSQEIVLDPLTQDQVDEFKSFISGINMLEGSIPDDIISIIQEEAEPFFQGQKSVDDVTPIIQSRASIYLKEKQ